MSCKDKVREFSFTTKLRCLINNLLTFLFLLVIFSVPIFWLIRGNNPEEWSLIEERNLKKFSIDGLGFKNAGMELIHGNTNQALELFSDLEEERVLQAQFEKAASDQFPLRISAINKVRAIDRLFIKFSYFPLSDSVIPTDMRSGVYIWRDNSYFLWGPKYFRESTRTSIDFRIGNYNNLINQFPEVNFFLYYIEPIEYSQLNPLLKHFKLADGYRYFEFFKEHKPNGLTLSTLEINSVNDYFRYFYKTDHHLNNNGVYSAYLGIHELLKNEYFNISSPLEIEDEIIFHDINFLGSLARASDFPTQGDVFKVFFFALPPYKVYEDGKEYSYGKSDEYFSGNYSVKPYINHYGEYYGYDNPYLEFVFENLTDRNVLVIGDSYDNALLPLIASHYHHTYSIDLRHYRDFSLSNFLKDHPVDDILVIGESSAAFSSCDWVINP